MDMHLDIETIESQEERIREHVINKAIAKCKPEDNVDDVAAEAIRQTALSGAFGEIVTIGIAIENEEPEVFARTGGATELDVISAFIRRMRELHRESIIICGHNVFDFDREFIRQRCIVNGVHAPTHFTREIKPWEMNGVFFDSMRQWSQLFGKEHRISLNDLAVVLGLSGKGDTSGGDVGDLWRAGNVNKIIEYQADDVRLGRAVKHRMTNLERA